MIQPIRRVRRIPTTKFAAKAAHQFGQSFTQIRFQKAYGVVDDLVLDGRFRRGDLLKTFELKS